MSRKKDVYGSKFYEYPENIVRDGYNMTLLKCLEYEQKLRAPLESEARKNYLRR